MQHHIAREQTHFVQLTPGLRRKLEATLDNLIDLLDALEDDPDLEDTHDAEAYADDEEPSLGSTNHRDQSKAWNSSPGLDLEFEGDTVAECDRELEPDREIDPAEDGIADDDGYREQIVGEPSLGSTHDINQELAWLAGGRDDCEATGTVDDLAPLHSAEAWRADRDAADRAREQVRALVRHQRSRVASAWRSPTT